MVYHNYFSLLDICILNEVNFLIRKGKGFFLSILRFTLAFLFNFHVVCFRFGCVSRRWRRFVKNCHLGERYREYIEQCEARKVRKISFLTTVFFESILCVKKKVTVKHEMNVSQ